MLAIITDLEFRTLTLAACPDGLVLAEGAHFTCVHIKLWKAGYVRLFQPICGPRRLRATAAGLRVIGATPEALRVVS